VTRRGRLNHYQETESNHEKIKYTNRSHFVGLLRDHSLRRMPQGEEKDHRKQRHANRVCLHLNLGSPSRDALRTKKRGQAKTYVKTMTNACPSIAIRARSIPDAA